MTERQFLEILQGCIEQEEMRAGSRERFRVTRLQWRDSVMSLGRELRIEGRSIAGRWSVARPFEVSELAYFVNEPSSLAMGIVEYVLAELRRIGLGRPVFRIGRRGIVRA